MPARFLGQKLPITIQESFFSFLTFTKWHFPSLRKSYMMKNNIFNTLFWLNFSVWNYSQIRGGGSGNPVSNLIKIHSNAFHCANFVLVSFTLFTKSKLNKNWFPLFIFFYILNEIFFFFFQMLNRSLNGTALSTAETKKHTRWVKLQLLCVQQPTSLLSGNPQIRLTLWLIVNVHGAITVWSRRLA